MTGNELHAQTGLVPGLIGVTTQLSGCGRAPTQFCSGGGKSGLGDIITRLVFWSKHTETACHMKFI